MPDTVSSSDDHEEFVIFDDEADIAGLPALDEAAHVYLAAQGISPATAAAFRVGNVPPAVLARFGLTGRRAPEAGGICIPTWSPLAPKRTAGVIRLNFGQSRHRFITPAVGIAGPGLVTTAPRVVLAATPLLALHLHQAGVLDAAMVEDPAVLAPLRGWLSEREVVVAGHRQSQLAALRAGLGDQGAAARGVLVSQSFQLSAEVRRVLGLGDALRAERPPITPRLLSLIHGYAVGRLATAEGHQALAACGFDNRVLLDAYRPGYIPSDFRDALTDADRRALTGRRWTRSLVLPAVDDRGCIVDLCVAQVADGGHVLSSVWDTPRGLIAPALTTAFQEVVITDSPRWIAHLSRNGKPALLLRGVADAQVNAGRLVAGGVRSAEVHAVKDGEEIAAVLRLAGISVQVRGRDALAAVQRPAAMTPVEMTADAASTSGDQPLAASTSATGAACPTVELIRHDEAAERAEFRCGESRLSVQVPWGASTTLHVAIAVGDHCHQEDIDLGVPAQRLRFALCASLRVGLPSAMIANALVDVLPQVQALAQPATVPPASVVAHAMSVEEHDAALALLRDDHLMDRLLTDMERLGWVGEPETKAIVLLSAISRLAPDPVWIALTATLVSERFPALGILAAITPPEHCIQVARLSDTALHHTDANALRHTVLLLDDATALSPAVATALRVLRSRGSLTASVVERDPLQGVMRTRFTQARGPVAVITAAVGQLPDALAPHLFVVPVDESAEQADRVLAARRRHAAMPGTSQMDEITTRLRQAQCLLEARPVIVPDMERVAIPPRLARNRTLQDALFGLITASALLHQYQRPFVDGHVVATTTDIDLATRLVTSVALRMHDGLSLRAQRLLTALRAAKVETFTMEHATALPDWPRSTARRAIDDLIDADYAVALRGRQGQARSYRLLLTTYDDAEREHGHMASPGHATWPAPTPEAACG